MVSISFDRRIALVGTDPHFNTLCFFATETAAPSGRVSCAYDNECYRKNRQHWVCAGFHWMVLLAPRRQATDDAQSVITSLRCCPTLLAFLPPVLTSHIVFTCVALALCCCCNSQVDLAHPSVHPGIYSGLLWWCLWRSRCLQQSDSINQHQPNVPRFDSWLFMLNSNS